MVVFANTADQSCSSVDDSLKSSKLTLWQSDERCIAVVDVRENEGLDSKILHHNTSVNTSHFYQMNLAGNDLDPPRHSNFQFHVPAPISAIAHFE